VSVRNTRVVAVDPRRPDETAIAEAAALIRGGALVAFPTETVYGLGAAALDCAAVGRIFEAKRRPPTDPLIVHIAGANHLARLARSVPEIAMVLADHFWPGPLTLIVPKSAEVPDEVTAGLDTVAVRVPAHPVARALLTAAAVPIAAPSANLFSRPSPTRAAHVMADLNGRIDMLLDGGPADIGVESTVLDLTAAPPRIRRPGGVSLEQLRAVVPSAELAAAVSSAAVRQVSPGQLLRHYAPRARMTLFDGNRDRVREHVRAEAMRVAGATRVGILAPEEDICALRAQLEGAQPIVLRAYGSLRDPSRSARELFDAIRSLDAAEVAAILAIGPEPAGIGVAIRDRLTRAAEGRVVNV
jgi:L-threonylcarbamoyladenylate synthase